MSPLAEVAALFLRLGFTAFGGPAAHIGIMHDEVVVKQKWLTDEEFLDLLGATNLIPGPNSTEMAIHIGYVRAGWPGLLAGGLGFILPATFIGYLLGGTSGALLATLGIFLPSFVFVAIANRLIPKIRNSIWTSGLLDGVNASALGLMGAVTVQLARYSLTDLCTIIIAIISLILLWYYKMNSTWLIAGGAIAGFIFSSIQ
jgi:chromate transporter